MRMLIEGLHTAALHTAGHQTPLACLAAWLPGCLHESLPNTGSRPGLISWVCLCEGRPQGPGGCPCSLGAHQAPAAQVEACFQYFNHTAGVTGAQRH